MATRSSTSIGVVVSLALHAGFAATLLRYGDRWLSPSPARIPADTPLLIPILPAPTPQPRAQDEPPLPEPLKLGIDDGQAQGDTWLGFKDPTPHSGPASSRDQAQMTLEAPSAPSPAVEEQLPSPPTSQAQPTDQTPDQTPPVPSSTETAKTEAQPEPNAAPPTPDDAKEPIELILPPETVPGATTTASLSPAESAKPAPPTVDRKADQPEPGERLLPVPAPEQKAAENPNPELSVPAPTPETNDEQSPEARPDAKPQAAPDVPMDLQPEPDANELPANPADLVGPPAPAERDLAEREHAERERVEREFAERAAAQASSPIPARQASKPRPARRAGEVSDRESDAAAVRSAINVDPNGGPAATKGLKIKTVRPEWSTTTRLVALPKNPVVRVRFNRAGKVVDANFVDRYDTGWPDVDGPLLDAIYRWKAEGERLRELPENDPDAVITVTFRITLRTGP
ncbi:MAG: hypothetical protein IT434_10520 [Phycisphaerales bacterium]|jgi:hypothetical protein|nr:hypothetical protein [Phycisphaerales bacterium]